MGKQLKIKRVEVHQFQWDHKNLGYDYNGFNWVYKPDSKVTRTDYVLQVFKDQGIFGEFAGGSEAESRLKTVCAFRRSN
jgi:hypothetical protein